MPDKQHAVLSASSSYRWLACPPSALECAKRPDTTSDFAREGTDAHTLCEYKVKEALGRKAQNPTGTLDYYSEEMRVQGSHRPCRTAVGLLEMGAGWVRYRRLCHCGG